MFINYFCPNSDKSQFIKEEPITSLLTSKILSVCILLIGLTAVVGGGAVSENGGVYPGISEQAINGRLRRAKKKMANYLRRNGFGKVQ